MPVWSTSQMKSLVVLEKLNRFVIVKDSELLTKVFGIRKNLNGKYGYERRRNYRRKFKSGDKHYREVEVGFFFPFGKPHPYNDSQKWNFFRDKEAKMYAYGKSYETLNN